ncbi:GntR family transcriptional regulator [Rhodovarius crocodyli]|uniref:GntR family transcriptional regulator n=1 Tax=Rhodovarius crocodyli TaxID=1979269 RepID=A0A437M3C3_9PROT|nr:GntR family transcriptional regulator [Rhodovarius crocodyli]RVT92200.1 GntR family transcriptional regulator [Rhodovarius crocodyli]
MADHDTASSTIGSQVYARLREDVISGALPPGSKLHLDSLRARYGVGMTPLREALYRLTSTLLIEAHDQRGFRVADIGLSHFEQVISARERLECLLLEDAIRDGDAAWLARTEAAHDTLAALPMYLDAECRELNLDWRHAHLRFHYELASGGRHFIQNLFHQMLWDHSTRYRNLLHPAPLPEEVLRADHARLMETVRERDAEMAVLVMRRHVRHGSAAILAALKAGGVAPRPLTKGAALGTREGS